MTPQEIKARLSARPEICQEWESAVSVGEDGIVYLSRIMRDQESIGMVHIYLWGKEAMGQPGRIRDIARNLMIAERLDRLMAEIDSRNHLALNLAKRVGFNTIGVVRQRKVDDGRTLDVVLMDALPGDLTWQQPQQ